ncbi:MAG TPA: hypothetical protein VGJ20_15910 [Xanthobacteraceae bacterium]
MAATDIHQTIETVFRIERARLIAGVTRLVRVGLAGELAQDALVTALSEWPKNGVPAHLNELFGVDVAQTQKDNLRGASRRPVSGANTYVVATRCIPTSDHPSPQCGIVALRQMDARMN